MTILHSLNQYTDQLLVLEPTHRAVLSTWGRGLERVSNVLHC